MKGGQSDDFRVVEPADVPEQVLDEHAGLGLRLVHFPVAGDDFFAVDHKEMGLNSDKRLSDSPC